MDYIRLTRQFSFETAHALLNYNGPCKNIHGHSYKLQVTILGKPITDTTDPKYGMVMDFGDLKKMVNETIVAPLDHALILREDTDPELVAMLQQLNHKLVLTSYQPTCENMLIEFRKKLQISLPKSVQLHSLRLWETENSFAEWFASDNV
ncbi:6-carboxytetrahydropterin synthase [Pontibacter sp. KCTC 32443]|uniref:6-pyruvoyl trahydropterin synthase family protein n=1 Tax=Pontibacter TaxID=323449 RepID=UPI00164DA656|nr:MULTISPECIES: 6-carboxytetrahydropterin synthase [Pontibacter]MBC5774798.1 6-carboxytetrahydropterin synthase [Pontibacter sp. KCTC 32443]